MGLPFVFVCLVEEEGEGDDAEGHAGDGDEANHPEDADGAVGFCVPKCHIEWEEEDG